MVDYRDNLVACHTCGRNFAQDRIDLHEKICAKTMSKKRKQFDAMTFRVRGTELEPFVKKGVAKKQEVGIPLPFAPMSLTPSNSSFLSLCTV